MFQKGDYIHHATNGLCKVEDITTLDMSGAQQGRMYYRLSPVEGNGGTVYTPVDNQKVAMRPAMTRQEADALINEIPQIDLLWIKEEKAREHTYREALMSGDSKCWVQIIKTLYVRRQDRLAHGRKVTSTDEKYLRSAQERLYGELALALGMQRDQMEDYITSRLG